MYRILKNILLRCKGLFYLKFYFNRTTVKMNH